MDVRNYIDSVEHIREDDTIRIPYRCSAVQGTLAIDWQSTHHGRNAYRNLLTQFAAAILASFPNLSEEMVEKCWISTTVDDAESLTYMTCILQLKA